MDRNSKEFLKDVCRDQSRSLVGKLCKRIELLQDKNTDLTEDQKLSILKNFCKELVYENFRDLRNSIIFYSEGRKYKKMKIYNPTKDKKS